MHRADSRLVGSFSERRLVLLKNSQDIHVRNMTIYKPSTVYATFQTSNYSPCVAEPPVQSSIVPNNNSGLRTLRYNIIASGTRNQKSQSKNVCFHISTLRQS